MLWVLKRHITQRQTQNILDIKEKKAEWFDGMFKKIFHNQPKKSPQTIKLYFLS